MTEGGHWAAWGLPPPPPPPPEDPPPGAGDPPPAPWFATPDAFLDWARQVFPREAQHGKTHHWCATWWAHAEALVVVEAAWRSFEALRREPALGMATWLTGTWYPLLDRLLAPDGPFALCHPGRGHTALPPLPVTPAPAGLFTPADLATPQQP